MSTAPGAISASYRKFLGERLVNAEKMRYNIQSFILVVPAFRTSYETVPLLRAVLEA